MFSSSDPGITQQLQQAFAMLTTFLGTLPTQVAEELQRQTLWVQILTLWFASSKTLGKLLICSEL